MKERDFICAMLLGFTAVGFSFSLGITYSAVHGWGFLSVFMYFFTKWIRGFPDNSA